MYCWVFYANQTFMWLDLSSKLRGRFALGETRLHPPVKYFYWPFQGGTSFVDHCVFVSCVSHTFASVHCCLVVAWRERSGLLALVGDVIVFLILPHVVSWVRCRTWLFRFLIIAFFLTCNGENQYFLEIDNLLSLDNYIGPSWLNCIKLYGIFIGLNMITFFIVSVISTITR